MPTALRARNGARLFLDGKLILESPFHTINGSAHGKIRHVEVIQNETIRPLGTGDNEKVVEIEGDGKPHRLRLELYLGGKKKRPELGETSVSLEGEDGTFRILSPRPEWRFALTDEEFHTFRERDRLYQRNLNAERRQIAGKDETKYWNRRHQIARSIFQKRPAIALPSVKNPKAVHNPIDQFINHRLEAAKKSPAALIDDWAFLRRATLDILGTVPTPEQIETFFADDSPHRRARCIDRLLAEDGWADHWVAYWQDVLAENPNIVNPTLNNTGPFRGWIHESFLDNKPFDRFATELIRMEGSRLLRRAGRICDGDAERCADGGESPYHRPGVFGAGDEVRPLPQCPVSRFQAIGFVPGRGDAQPRTAGRAPIEFGSRRRGAVVDHHRHTQPRREDFARVAVRGIGLSGFHSEISCPAGPTPASNWRRW